MIRINDIIFSLDLIVKRFRCNLPLCLGNCCRYGDSGAPVAKEEIGILDEILPAVKPYLRPDGVRTIEREGTSVVDFEGDIVTPLIGNEECAYTILNDNIFMCGIEKACLDGKISFRKPVSCHLFPARVKYFKDFTAVNYRQLSMCHSAVDTGEKEDTRVYEFLKEPLIRAFGEETYKDLCIAAEEIRKNPGRFGV